MISVLSFHHNRFDEVLLFVLRVLLMLVHCMLDHEQNVRLMDYFLNLILVNRDV